MSGKPRKTIRSKEDLLRLRRQIAVYERFHLFCLIFFLSTMIAAIVHGRISLAILILIANMIYNVYPLLIQQYNRMRMGQRRLS